MKIVREYLAKVTEMRRQIRSNKKYSCIEEFVLKNGKEFTSQNGEKLKRGRMKQCFKNAYHLAEDFNLIYVEGYASFMGLGFPVLHAWCVGKDGNVYDPTWKNGGEYFGVPFDLMYVRKIILRRERFGVIDNVEMGFPLLAGKDTDFKNTEVARAIAKGRGCELGLQAQT